MKFIGSYFIYIFIKTDYGLNNKFFSNENTKKCKNDSINNDLKLNRSGQELQH